MKGFKKLIFLAIAVIISIALTACSTFEGFDDDAAILKQKGSSTVGSIESPSASEYFMRAEKFNGVKTIKSITVPENPVFDLTLNIDSGRFKVVLVKDNSVTVICDKNTDEPVAVTLNSGTYSLRIVGEDAKFQFTFVYNSYQ